MLRVLLLPILAFAALGGPPTTAAERIEVDARPIALDRSAPGRAKIGALAFRGALELRSSHRRFGGFSSLDISPDGTRLLAVSDRGHWLAARLRYRPLDRVAGVVDARLGPVRGVTGRLGWWQRDSEALARLPDGRLVVGFEGAPRLRRYGREAASLGRRPQAIGLPAVAGFAARNAGIEALTALADGRLFLLLEDLPADRRFGPGTHAGWVQTRTGWAPFAYDRVGLWRPTGAATIPAGGPAAGDVIIVERALSLFLDITARVMHVRGRSIKAEARISPTELAHLGSGIAAGNIEGIAARRAPDGTILIYLISDNNFRSSQPTRLLMFAWPGAAKQATQ